MKVQYASDLHIEFPVNASFLEKIPLSDESNILVLAGDIAYLEKKMLKNHPFFDWCSRTFEQTLIIPGNHEFYRGYPVENTLDGWEYFVRPNVRYINNKSFVIGDVEIFCTTLWSEIDHWIHGHVHMPMQSLSGKPQIHSNPMGYVDDGENREFRNNAVIELQ